MAESGYRPQTDVMVITNPWVTFKRTALLGTFTLGAALLSLTVVEEAKAAHCKNKTAVCMMQKAESKDAKSEEAKPKARATAPSKYKPCGTKTAICMLERQRDEKPQAVQADRPVQKASAVTTCNSKPAVCQRQRMKAARARK